MRWRDHSEVKAGSQAGGEQSHEERCAYALDVLHLDLPPGAQSLSELEDERRVLPGCLTPPSFLPAGDEHPQEGERLDQGAVLAQEDGLGGILWEKKEEEEEEGRR